MPEDQVPVDAEVTGVVLAIEADRAAVALGDSQEHWDFPAEMLPERAEAGSYLLVTMVDGRPASCELHHERELVARKGLDNRLARLARYEQLTGHEVRVE